MIDGDRHRFKSCVYAAAVLTMGHRAMTVDAGRVRVRIDPDAVESVFGPVSVPGMYQNLQRPTHPPYLPRPLSQFDESEVVTHPSCKIDSGRQQLCGVCGNTICALCYIVTQGTVTLCPSCADYRGVDRRSPDCVPAPLASKLTILALKRALLAVAASEPDGVIVDLVSEQPSRMSLPPPRRRADFALDAATAAFEAAADASEAARLQLNNSKFKTKAAKDAFGGSGVWDKNAAGKRKRKREWEGAYQQVRIPACPANDPSVMPMIPVIITCHAQRSHWHAQYHSVMQGSQCHAMIPASCRDPSVAPIITVSCPVSHMICM